MTKEERGGNVIAGMHPLLEDPWIAAQVDAAVAPYEGRLSDEEISWMRDQLAVTLASDDKASLLLRRARPLHVEESGEVRRDGGLDAARRKKAKAR